MSGVVRWDIDTGSCDTNEETCRAEMTATDNGDYVLWEDHSKEVEDIKFRCTWLHSDLEQQVADLTRSLGVMTDDRDFWKMEFEGCNTVKADLQRQLATIEEKCAKETRRADKLSDECDVWEKENADLRQRIAELETQLQDKQPCP